MIVLFLMVCLYIFLFLSFAILSLFDLLSTRRIDQYIIELFNDNVCKIFVPMKSTKSDHCDGCSRFQICFLRKFLFYFIFRYRLSDIDFHYRELFPYWITDIFWSIILSDSSLNIFIQTYLKVPIYFMTIPRNEKRKSKIKFSKWVIFYHLLRSQFAKHFDNPPLRILIHWRWYPCLSWVFIICPANGVIIKFNQLFSTK